MTTTIGKVLVFTLVIFSLAGLGMAAWLAADRRDWKAELPAVRKEIAQDLANRDLQERALRALLVEMNEGRRVIPWQTESPDGKKLDAPKLVPVFQARQEIDKWNNEVKDQLTAVAQLEGQITTLQGAISDAIDKTKTGLAEYKRLRQLITPDPGQNGQKAMRDLIAEQRAAQDAAEAEQEKIKPKLLLAREQVLSVQRRVQQQKQRLEELGKATGISARVRP
jgi:hypothetical protein